MTGAAIPGTGLGVDVHRFGGPGPLLLGGVTIEYSQGLVGHSDGDVLCHAVADAVLGAACLGDLGEHFPSSDSRWRGASSVDLLRLVTAMLAPLDLVVSGVDATVLAEAPRLQPQRSEMAECLRQALQMVPGACSVKVKSTDGLGLIGRGEGIAALAIATVRPGNRGSSQ